MASPRHEWLKALVESSNNLLAISNLDGNLAYLNQAGFEMVGISGGVLAHNFRDFFGRTDENDICREVLDAVSSTGKWENDAHFQNLSTGEVFPVAVLAKRIGEGKDALVEWTVRDRRRRAEMRRQITQRVQEQRVIAELAQEALHNRWLDLLRSSVKAVAKILDVELVIVTQPVADSDKLHVVAKHDMVAMNLRVLSAGLKSQSGCAITTGRAVITPDVSVETNWDTTVARQYGLASGMAVPILQGGRPWGALSLHSLKQRNYSEDDVAFLEAISSVLSYAQRRIGIENEIRHQALHDSLTGLPNRLLAQDRLQHAIETLHGEGALVAVLILDLDDFKTVNDSMGHDNGDRLLQDFVPRLREYVHEGDTVARLGGDEFMILCEDAKSPLDAVDLATQIQNSWSEPFQMEERSLFLSGSIGITVGKADSKVVELMREADTAMYRSKQKGRGGFEVYEEAMGELSSDRFQLASDLHAAIEQDQLWLAYQPIYELGTGRLAFVEALCRWNHPNRGLIAPDVFIPLAEQTGQIGRLGSWVLKTACHDAASWSTKFPGLPVSVNVSATQLQSFDLVDEVRGVLLQAGLSPDSLGLEVTENMLIDYGDVPREVILRLKELGVELLIDDYGTGYSSIGYLARFPQLSMLKIDKELTHLAMQERQETIVSSIVTLGHSMGMKVVAEGIETQEQLECIVRVGCDYGQGFLFGEGVPLSRLDEYLGGAPEVLR